MPSSPVFTPPVTDGRLVGDPSDRRSWGYFKHLGAWATGETVWKDQAGVWHRSIVPYAGGATHTVHDWDVSTTTAPDAGLATAQEVFLGGHEHQVTEAKRAELIAAGFFVGGHWASEETKWVTFATNSAVDRGFKAGDATCSIAVDGGASSFWCHADTIVGDVDAAGSIVNHGTVKNSVVLRSGAGTLDGQLFADGAGISPAWKHPSHPSVGFTPMDMAFDGTGGVGAANAVAVGWAEPTTFGGANGEGLLLTLTAFGTAGTFIEYSLANGKFFLTGVYNDTTYHYLVGRESDFTEVLPGGGVFNNDAQRNWTRLGRVPLGQLTTPANWQFWNGSSWISDQSAAVNNPYSRFTDSNGQPINGITDITKSGSNYILAVIHPKSPSVRLYKSTVVTGPWTPYHTTADPDRIPDGGEHPPEGLRYWSGFPKFHEYLNPDSKTLILTHSHGVYAPNLTTSTGPIHISQSIPNFVYLPTPEAVA